MTRAVKPATATTLGTISTSPSDVGSIAEKIGLRTSWNGPAVTRSVLLGFVDPDAPRLAHRDLSGERARQPENEQQDADRMRRGRVERVDGLGDLRQSENRREHAHDQRDHEEHAREPFGGAHTPTHTPESAVAGATQLGNRPSAEGQREVKRVCAKRQLSHARGGRRPRDEPNSFANAHE